MSRRFITLLIEDNPEHARQTSRAIEALSLPPPVQIESGEAGVLWIGANECDVCLLDYDLPGIDGLETLARIRQRRPELPVIMLSGASSERVAVAAFHAGVVDYLPKHAGFAEAAAELVRQIALSGPGAQLAPPVVIGPGVPEELLRLSYQNRLRVIGRHLDLYGYRGVNILEVSGGFLVRGLASGSRTAEALEFTERDFPQLLATAIAARGEGERLRMTSDLLPTGYEDALRGIGRRLDERRAEAITVGELPSFLAIGGVAPTENMAATMLSPLQWLLRKDELAYLLDEAFRLRAAVAQSRGLLNRVLGRETGS